MADHHHPNDLYNQDNQGNDEMAKEIKKLLHALLLQIFRLDFAAVHLMFFHSLSSDYD
jgi:hypothetical protein